MRFVAFTCLALFLATAQAAAAPSITVTMSVAPAAGRSPAFAGRTNLPDETALSVTAETPGGRVLQQQLVSVIGGRFTTARFGPFAPGRYVLHVVSYAPVLQPPTVQAVIGEFGEHLAGHLVAPGKALPDQGNVVDAHFPMTIR